MQSRSYPYISSLLVVTVLTGFCADYCKFVMSSLEYSTLSDAIAVVESVKKTVEKYSISERFIGIILIPIVVRT